MGFTQEPKTCGDLPPIESLQIIVTVPVLLDLLLCHSCALLPREESRSFPTSSSGIRDSSRAPDTRPGMTRKIRASGRACHYFVQDSISWASGSCGTSLTTSEQFQVNPCESKWSTSPLEVPTIIRLSDEDSATAVIG